jgi:hypothetical protein
VQTQVWLLTAVVLVVMPHIPRLPLWLALSAAVVMLFKLLMLRRTGSQGTLRGLLQLLTLASAGGVYLHYHTLLGRDAGVALLVSMLLLKLLELRTARDAHLVVLLGYFLVITNFLFTQTILIALYMFVTTTVITATLAVIARGDTPRPVRDQLRLAGVLLAQAVPLMLVLFVFFPRIAGPGWGLPEDSNSGMTGLGNSLPGKIHRGCTRSRTALLARPGTLAHRWQDLDTGAHGTEAAHTGTGNPLLGHAGTLHSYPGGA